MATDKPGVYWYAPPELHDKLTRLSAERGLTPSQMAGESLKWYLDHLPTVTNEDILALKDRLDDIRKNYLNYRLGLAGFPTINWNRRRGTVTGDTFRERLNILRDMTQRLNEALDALDATSK